MKIILDTSIIIKWFLPTNEEKNLDFATQIQNTYANGECILYAPALIFYEITNVLNSAVKFKRAPLTKILEILSLVEELQIITYDIRESIPKTLMIALDADLSIYDASYVQLSDELNIPFFTADKKLYRKVKAKYKLVKFITEFKSESN